VGTGRAKQILDSIAEGTARLSDLKDLETLADGLYVLSNCGLGQTAATPIRDILRHFRAEVEAHVRLKICPTGVCPMSGRLAKAA
jgi:NADP-reducing hydrogenase subunit HndC